MSTDPADHSGRRIVLVLLTGILLAAGAIYVYFATMHAPQVDEAVFGRGSLAILDGDLMLHGWRVMKPYMVYYAQALARLVLGTSAFAGRMPGILSSLAILWLLFRIGRRWFDQWTGLVAALLLAFSPYVIFHYPTGRADALSLVFILAAVELAGRGRSGWAGFTYALSFCTRQLAAFSFPLVIAVLLLDGHLALPVDTPWRRMAGRRIWRYALGSLPPLVVLLFWSMFTKIPFAWLVNELQGEKYATGKHLAKPFVEKLAFWVGESASFFAWLPLAVLALALVALAAVLLAVWRARRRWTVRTRPDLAFLAVLTAFVFFFYLVHSVRELTMYQRFLAPVTPWVMLIASFGAVAGMRGIVTRAPKWRRILPAVSFAVLAVVLVIPAVQYTQSLRTPVSADDIPLVVQWLESRVGAGATVLTSQFGPETDYATWHTRVAAAQFDRKPELLPAMVAERAGRALFLYLDANDQKRWLAQIQSLLAPQFVLHPVDELRLPVGRLYRVEALAAGGVAGGQVTYLEDGRLTTTEFNCDMLGWLLQEAFARQRKYPGRPPLTFAWRACDPTAEPAELSFAVTGFEHQRLPITLGEFSFEWPRLDWPALLIARQFVVQGGRAGRAVFHLDTADLARFIAARNRNLADVTVAVEPQRLILRAVAKFGPWSAPLTVAGRIELQGRQVWFALNDVRLGGRVVPRFAWRYAEAVINPVLTADLREWSLWPIGVRVELPAEGETNGGLVIEAAIQP